MAAFIKAPAATTPKKRRESSGPILCVGSRAFVHWPTQARAETLVPLTDANGASLPNDLADGQQVEIVSWRPRAREGLTYQIRRLADGREGWLVAHHLRRQATVDPAEASAVGSR